MTTRAAMALRQQDAMARAEVARQWREWRRYLQAHLTLLTTSDDEVVEPALEAEEARGSERARAQRDLAALEPQRRAVFDRYRAGRRAEVQARLEAEARARGGRAQPVDPDLVDLTTLRELIDEAEGSAPGCEGWGRVPMPDRVYRVDVEAILAEPGAEAYSAGGAGESDARQRLVIAGLLLAGLALFLAWWFAGRGAPETAEAGTPAQPSVNGVAQAVWRPRELVLTGADGASRSVVLLAAEGSSLPAAAAGDAVGAWWPDVVAPVRLCVPAGAREGAVSARLISAGDAPDRVYALRASGEGGYDLSIETCGGEAGASTLYGSLESTAAPASLEVGDAGALPSGATVRVTGVAVVGPGEDISLPPGQARVLVSLEVSDTRRLDLPALSPRLLLADGTTSEAPRAEAGEGTALLQFLIPLHREPVEAAFNLTAASGELLRWRTTLPPAPNRLTVVQSAIRVEEVVAGVDGLGLPVLRVTLTNVAAGPIQLVTNDIELVQGEAQLPLAELAELQDALAPGERRTLTVPLPDLGPRPATLIVGAQRYEVAPPERGW